MNTAVIILIIFLMVYIVNYKTDFILLLQAMYETEEPQIIKSLDSNIIDPEEFDKFKSIQPVIRFIFGINIKKPDDSTLGVFTRNLENRGEDECGNNALKRKYYMALLPEVIDNYDEHMDVLLDSIHADCVIDGKPFLSSFHTHLITYYLTIHLGIDESRPQFVYDFFYDIVELFGKGYNRDWDTLTKVIGLRQNSFKVKDYFKERIDEIKAISPMPDNLIVTHWFNAGFEASSVLVAAFHNIIAFSQFLHTTYLITQQHFNIMDRSYINRFNNPENTEIDKRRILFEIFKTEVPNSGSLSLSRFNGKIVKHSHKDIMKNAQGDYNTEIETFLQTPPEDQPTQCPFFNSIKDNQTVIPHGSGNQIPVFDTPLYTSFGLGYRRCPGELLSYRVISKLLVFLYEHEIIKRDDTYTQLISVGPKVQGFDNIFLS